VIENENAFSHTPCVYRACVCVCVCITGPWNELWGAYARSKTRSARRGRVLVVAPSAPGPSPVPMVPATQTAPGGVCGCEGGFGWCLGVGAGD